VQNLHANLPMVVRRFRILPLLIPFFTCPKPRFNGLLTLMVSSPATAASHRTLNFGEFTFQALG
jgi:hypothetical protein